MVHCSPQRRRLCSSLIKEFFGDTVERICSVLVARGQQTLPEVVHASSLPAPTVRSALLVLLQHNFVVPELVKPDADLRAAPPPYYLYHADTGAIIQMLRMPRILQHVQRDYGGPCESDMAMQIIEVLLAHGRLRLGQIVAAVAARLGKPEGEVWGELHPRFISLVNSRHVERVPPADLPLPKPRAHGKPQGKKKAEPKEGSKEKAEQEAEQVRKLAQKSYSDERFQLPIELLFGAAAPKAAKPAARAKRKRDEGGDGGGQEPEGSTSQPLWRVNFEEFNCRLRDEACAEHIAEMHGREPAALVAAMLRHAAQQPGGGRADAEVSGAVSAAAAAEQLAQMRRRQPELPMLTINAASRILCELAEDARSGVKRVGLQEAFFVDLCAITKAMRQMHIEAIVRDRFPPIGMRVFRLLTAKKQLEQKQVADYAMVPVRDARELLYRMLRAGFLTLQDVPRTADHAASRTLYTWRVDAAAVTRRVGEELLQTAANLRARLHRELTEHGEVLARVEAGDPVLLPRERAEVGRVSRMSALLETRLIALDPLIALFHR
ncbi:g9132 [Coccomyxa elongata]